jgi:hypothetical protein
MRRLLWVRDRPGLCAIVLTPLPRSEPCAYYLMIRLTGVIKSKRSIHQIDPYWHVDRANISDAGASIGRRRSDSDVEHGIYIPKLNE